MVVGSDLINSIYSWKEWREIEKKVNIICFKRFGYDNIDFKNEDILFLNSVNINVSSSSIKKEIFSNRLNNFANFSNMISKDIYDYIYKNRLDIK